jgi:pimeloyl-ACP methyl ester carboxylesterase
MIFLLVVAALAVLGFVCARVAPERVTALGLAAERRLAGLRLRTARVGQFDMPYLEGGRGEPLVLVHGFGGDKDNFTRIARFLTPHFRVIIPDLPGFGDATRDPGATYSMSDQVARLRNFLEQLGIHACHLGGNSMGGFISAQYAATWPLAVKSLWLLDPAGTLASHSSDMLQHYEKTGLNPLLVATVDAFDGTIAATTHKAPFLPRFARTTLGRRAVADFELHTRIMRQMQDSPLLENSYGALETPTLIVWGEHDKILSPQGAQSFAALFPNSQVVIMKGIGHLPMAEAPKQTAVDYMAFMRQRGLTVRE